MLVQMLCDYISLLQVTEIHKVKLELHAVKVLQSEAAKEKNCRSKYILYINQSTGLLFDITSSLASLNSEFQIKRSIIPAESYPLECMATFE